MAPLTFAQRIIGLVLFAFAFLLGIGISFCVLHELLRFSFHWLTSAGVVSDTAADIAEWTVLSISFLVLCWLNWKGCRRLWPYLLTGHYYETRR